MATYPFQNYKKGEKPRKPLRKNRHHNRLGHRKNEIAFSGVAQVILTFLSLEGNG